jgi:hypothetical protein
MTSCPNCHVGMATQTGEGHGALPQAVTVDLCAPCNLLWFDRSESIALTPQAVLGLFRTIGAAGKARNALGANLACPRCRHALAYTHDLQRTTRFTYWRCPDGHGRLITFTQFLAEKNFIRAPSPAELARLRATVRQIACSQCGAPVDLARDSACRHCGAPIALIDPDGVAKALADLEHGATAGTPPSQDATRAALSDAQIDALFNAMKTQPPEGRHDLLSIGAAAVGGLIGRWLERDGP